MSKTYNLDYEGVKQLEDAIKNYQEHAEEKITQYLHGKGYERFEKAIKNAMPESGRKWKKKKRAAKTAASLQDKNKSENLAVTIGAKTAYGYLYFPNDGSNTIHHHGNQRFFEKGVEAEKQEAANDMIELLTILEK